MKMFLRLMLRVLEKKKFVMTMSLRSGMLNLLRLVVLHCLNLGCKIFGC